MKLGLMSAILESLDFDGVIDFCEKNRLQCIEMACWPSGGAERRYAGVSHIDVEKVLADNEYTQHIKNRSEQANVEISALAYYPNYLDSNIEKRNAAIAHLKNVILASAKLGIGMVTTFIGRDQYKTVEENLRLVKDIWSPIINFAEENDVKIAIENCPMLFGSEQWPGGQNIMTTPVLWKKVFDILKSDKLGINYDPSHFIWQQIDYIKPIYDFKDKIFHVHCKDIKVYQERLDACGVMAYPLDYMTPKLPGLGDVDWGKYASALTDIGYSGNVCIEVEDRAFESTQVEIEKSILLSAHYLRNFFI